MAPTRTKITITGDWEDYYEEKIFIVDGREVTRYQCIVCSTSTSRKNDFPRHLQTHTDEYRFFCNVEGCDNTKGFHQLSNLRVHHEARHMGVKYVCPDVDEAGVECGQVYSDQATLINHRKKKHGRMAGQGPSYTITIIKQEADDGDVVIPPA